MGRDLEVVGGVLEHARRAPSVHNTQPWRWVLRRSASQDAPVVLELHADRSRGLPLADPDGRNLLISCGAALHHAYAVAVALGHHSGVTRLLDPDDPDLLARLHLEPSRRAPRRAVLELVGRRCTDRRRPAPWPIPDAALLALAAEAGSWGVRVLPLVDRTARALVESLVQDAHGDRAPHDPRLDEQTAWLDHSDEDGLPRGVLPKAGELPARRPNRFTVGLLPDEETSGLERTDGLLVLAADRDDPAAWLRAGEALSALWLRATAADLSVVPLTQVVEVPQTRRVLRHDVLAGDLEPLLLLRVGRLTSGLDPLPRTPRRPVATQLSVVG